MEVPAAARFAGKLDELLHRRLAGTGVGRVQRRVRLGGQPAESHPPLGSLGTGHPPVPGHVCAVPRQAHELGHLVEQ